MKTLLYIADNIQRMADGKLLMLGVYPDHVIQLNFPKDVAVRPTKEMPTVMNSLSIVVVIFEMPPGKRRVEPNMHLPNGEVSQKMAAVEFDTAETNTANLLFNFTPLFIPMEGIYRLEFEIDGERLSFPITIRFRSMDA